MNLLLEGNEIPNVYVSEENINILGCNALEEVFFDVFEIKTNSFEFVKEKKGDWNGNPIFELDVLLDNVLYKNCKFAIIKDAQTSINPSLLDPSKISIKTEKVEKIPYTNKTRLIKEETFVPKTPEPPKDIKKELESFIKEESSNGFIKEIIKTQFHSLLEDNPNDSKVTKFFNMYTEGFKKSFIEISEKIARREGLRAMESGGGTNSVQYADGGIMRGNLTIIGNLSAVNLQGNITSSGTVNKATFVIGDNINSNYILSHNFDNLNVIVQVYDNSTNEVVYPFIKNDDTNNTRISFPNVIGLNSYRVIILS